MTDREFADWWHDTALEATKEQVAVWRSVRRDLFPGAQNILDVPTERREEFVAIVELIFQK